MATSSPEASPGAASGTGRTFSMSRDKFNIDLPDAAPHLSLVTNGSGNATNGNGNTNGNVNGGSNGNGSGNGGNNNLNGINGNGTNGHTNINGNLNSPNSLKSPTSRRMQSFSREGILGSAQKARNLSQSSADRESIPNGISKPSSDDGSNPLKRRSTDAGIDYPRRRATIAVSRYLRYLIHSPQPLTSSYHTIVRDMPLSQIAL